MKKLCPDCTGSGKYQGGDMRKCSTCNGLGFINGGSMINELKELKETIEKEINNQSLLLSEARNNEQASYYSKTINFDKGQLNMLNHIIYKYEKEMENN